MVISHYSGCRLFGVPLAAILTQVIVDQHYFGLQAASSASGDSGEALELAENNMPWFRSLVSE